MPRWLAAATKGGKAGKEDFLIREDRVIRGTCGGGGAMARTLTSARWKLGSTSFGFVQRGSVAPFFALLQLIERQERHDALTAPAV